MRSIYITAFLIVFLSLPSLVFGARDPGERWRLIGKGITDTQWYLDTATLYSDSSGRVVVWIRSYPDSATPASLPEKETTREIIKDIQKRYFGDYGYTEGLWEIDCTGNTSRLFYFCAYTGEGVLLPSSVTADLRRLPLFPGGVGERIRDAVCDK